jgi:predicted dehydrogenase
MSRACLLDFEELLSRAATRNIRSLWFDEPPVADYELVLHLYALAEARGVLPWWARPVRHAASHRAARRLINRGEIGDVTSLSLRWNTSFGGKAEMFSNSNFAAIDLLLASASEPHEHRASGGMAAFLSMPHLFFVALNGLDHFEDSMRAQHALTQRFTAEYSIRAFLEKHPEATLARLRVSGPARLKS